jgi:formamidopyrimidine-DNA glycosylase
MPELPEVETVARGIAPQITGAVISEAWIDWDKVLDGVPLDFFNSQVRDQTVRGVSRRGKYICIELDRDFLVVHLRMTGRLYVSGDLRGGDPWVHFSLGFLDGRWLRFSDSRKFGRITLTRDLTYLEKKLGPEPLTLTTEQIEKILSGSMRAVKPFLLDQKRIAGLGNIYVDESLHSAGIHPETPVDWISRPARKRLAEAIPGILQQAIDHEGASINWYRKADGGKGESQEHFRVYGRQEQPCLACGSPIRKIFVAQRGTHFCPKCQRRPMRPPARGRRA